MKLHPHQTGVANALNKAASAPNRITNALNEAASAPNRITNALNKITNALNEADFPAPDTN